MSTPREALDAQANYNYIDVTNLTPQEKEKQDREIEQHLQNILLQIVQCDEFYCPDIQELSVASIYLATAIRHPNLFEKFQTCMGGGESDSAECGKAFTLMMQHNVPYVQDRLELKRKQYHKQPLLGYDGQKYNSPFWFEGAGNIWRITSHQPLDKPYVNVHDCHQIRTASEQCLADPNRPQDECFKLYGHALSCSAGVNCPELRFPLLYCLQAQNTVNYDGLKSCILKIPDYKQCTKAPKKPWVPDWDKGDV